MNGYQTYMCFEKIGLHAHNMIVVLGSIIKTFGGGARGGGLMWTFNEHENLPFDDEICTNKLQKY